MTTPNPSNAWDGDDASFFSALDEAPLWSVPFGRVLLDTVVLRRGLEVLDIGCGLGYPTLELAQRLGTSSRVTGLDPSPGALSRMRFKANTLGIGNVVAQEGGAEQMPFADASFDLVVSNNGMNNVQDWSAAWRECFRVAGPGAQIVVTMNLPETMSLFYDIYSEVLTETGHGERIEAMRAQINSKRKPLAQIVSLIERVGFTVRGVSDREFHLRYLDGTAMLNHMLIRIAFLSGFQSILDEADRAPVFEAVEARVNEHAQTAGSIDLAVPFVCIDCSK